MIIGYAAVVQPQRRPIDDRAFLDDGHDAPRVADLLIGVTLHDEQIGELAYKAGLDLETVLAVVSSGAAGSWSLTNYAPRMLKGDFGPGFYVEHFIKDLEIALAEARRMDLALPGLALAHELYLALRAQNGGRQGTQALVLALARLSNISWDPAGREA